MKKTNLYPKLHKFPPGIADLVTPVGIYLRIRDRFPNAILLESSDYRGNRNSMTYICFDVLSNIRVADKQVKIIYSDGFEEELMISTENPLVSILDEYTRSFNIDSAFDGKEMKTNGLFGYTSYDAVKYFDDIHFKNSVSEDYRIPEVNYSVYRFTIAINHFNNQLYLLENLLKGQKSRREEVNTILSNRTTGAFNFNPIEPEESTISDAEYMELVRKGKEHCQRGDVFQIVLSRQYRHRYKGDEFNVYRALRSINPSPYLFFFDYGGFKLFGSSPEAQIILNDMLY